MLMWIITSCSATLDREIWSRRVRGDLYCAVLPCWSLSTLNTGQDSGFERQASGHSYWPHSSLSPPSSTGLQGGSRCCSSRSGHLSPGPPDYLTPPPDLLLPSTFQPSVQSEGKPPLAVHSSVALPCSTLEGGRTLSLGCTTPTGGERRQVDNRLSYHHHS